MSRESVTGLIKDYLRAGKSMSETQALIKDSIMLSKYPFKGCDESKALRLEQSESQRL